MTANVMASDLQACTDAGMNDHVAKPIDPDALFGALLKWIPAREATQQESSDDKAKPEVGTTTDAVDTVAGLDVKSGLRRVLNKRPSYINLLRKFVTGQADATNIIRSQLTASDREAAQRTAHTLKGIAGTIGAGLLQDRAGAVEHSIKAGEEIVEVETLLVQQQEELARLIDALKRALPTEQIESNAAAVDWLQAKQIVAKIESLLTGDDPEALDIFKEHAALLRAALGGPASAVERDLDRFMFPEALAALRHAKSGVAQLN
jgi:two-component system sensor histidine kinase/response regulator